MYSGALCVKYVVTHIIVGFGDMCHARELKQQFAEFRP